MPFYPDDPEEGPTGLIEEPRRTPGKAEGEDLYELSPPEWNHRNIPQDESDSAIEEPGRTPGRAEG